MSREHKITILTAPQLQRASKHSSQDARERYVQLNMPRHRYHARCNGCTTNTHRGLQFPNTGQRRLRQYKQQLHATPTGRVWRAEE
jgi:hypothetical protein